MKRHGTVRQGISTRHEQTAGATRTARATKATRTTRTTGPSQVCEHLGEARVGEAPTVLGEVLLEVVEQQQQAVFAQQFPNPRDLVRILVTGVGEGGPRLDQLRDRDAAQGLRGRGDQRRRVPPADMHRHRPALSPQPGHYPPGNRCLADPAGPGQHHAGNRAPTRDRGAAAPQHRERGTDLPAPPDQITHCQLADAATGRRGKRVGQRPLVGYGVEQRRVTGRGQQRRGGVLGRREPAGGPRARPAVGVHPATGLGERRRDRHGAAGGQLRVEDPGQVGCVTVGDGRLHGQHPVGTTADQGLREPLSAAGRTRAGRQHDQWQRPGCALDRVHQLRCLDRDRVAVLVLQLHRGCRSVRGQVQHVVTVPVSGIGVPAVPAAQRVGDLRQAGDLEDRDLSGPGTRHRTDRVDDRLHLRLDVERGVLRPGLLRRRHRDEDLQRARQRRSRHPVQPGDPAGEPHPGHGGEQPSPSHPQQLVGQGERRAVGLHHDVHDHAERRAVDQLGDVPRGVGVEQHVPQPMTGLGQVRVRRRRLRGLCRPHRVEPDRQGAGALPQQRAAHRHPDRRRTHQRNRQRHRPVHPRDEDQAHQTGRPWTRP